MSQNPPSSLGYRLAALRKRRGYTQREIASLIHVSTQAYSQYETNARVPNLITLSEIASILQVSTDALVNGRSPYDFVIEKYLPKEVWQLPEDGIAELRGYVDYLLHKYGRG